MERIYRMRLDLIDAVDELLMRLLDALSAQRRKVWNAWDKARKADTEGITVSSPNR